MENNNKLTRHLLTLATKQTNSNNQYTTKFDTTYTTGNTNSLASKWAKVPTNQAPQTIKHTEDTPQATGDNTTVYYAANVPKTKTAGNYQTTITHTATANVLDPPEVEKVEPSTIRQGMSISASDSAFTCYLTDKGSVYCYGVNGNNFVRSGVQATDAIGPSSSVGGGWLKVDTTAFDSSSSSAGRTITITGSKLNKVTGVYIDSNKNGQLNIGTDVQCTNLSIKSDAELTCTVPQLSPGTYNLFVVNASNQTMVSNALTYR